MAANPDTETLIKALGLEPHPEGGYFRRTYCSALSISKGTAKDDDSRPTMTSIFYLLTAKHPIGHFHVNQSDIVHYYQLGGAIRYHLIEPDGNYRTVVMGNNLQAGQQLQMTVPGGVFKASELTDTDTDGNYGLISEAVTPGFDFRDMRMLTVGDITRRNARLKDELAHLCLE